MYLGVNFAWEKYSNQAFVLSPLKVPISNMLILSFLNLSKSCWITIHNICVL